MSDPQIELKRWFHEKTSPHGVKARLAEATGFTPTQISRMRNFETDDPKKRQEIPLDMIAQAARFFSELPPGFEGMTQWLDGVEPVPAGSSVIPFMGLIGAGAERGPDAGQGPPDSLDQVEIPFPLPDDMVAFKVDGISMLPVYRPGTILVVYREQKKPIESFYGIEAAVRTAKGRRYIKTITRGTQANTVNLMSFNADMIENVQLDWIGEIFAVLPPAAVRRVVRQGGLQGQLRLRGSEPRRLKAANFNLISEDRFDALVQGLLRSEFTSSQAGQLHPDSGVDIEARNAFLGNRAIINTKRTTGVVGETVVIQMLAEMAQSDVDLGVIVTNGKFTEAAVKAAAGKPISLVDGAMLMAIAERNQSVIPSDLAEKLSA